MRRFDFLRRLYRSASDAEDVFLDGLDLGGLFERLPETETADREFAALADSLGISGEPNDLLNDADNRTSSAHGLEGFINGWRMCEMLHADTALCESIKAEAAKKP